MTYFEEEKFFFGGKYFKQKGALPWDTCVLCDLDGLCTPFKSLPFCSSTTYAKEYEKFL